MQKIFFTFVFVASIFGMILAQTAPVKKLIDDLASPNSQVQLDALASLADMGPNAAPAVPSLCIALEDPNAYVRTFAANTLAQIGAAAKAALPALTKAMDDPDPSVSMASQTAIGAMGVFAKPAIPALIGKLRAWQSSAKESPAAYALVRIGEPAVPAMASLINDADKKIVLAGIFCIAETKSYSKTALDAYTTAMKNYDPEVCIQAAFALRKLGNPAVPVLIAALSSSDAFVRKQAAWSLGKMGEPAKPAIPKLKILMQRDKNPNVNSAVIWALEQLEGTQYKGGKGPAPEAPPAE